MCLSQWFTGYLSISAKTGCSRAIALDTNPIDHGAISTKPKCVAYGGSFGASLDPGLAVG
ncbi:hypothetical protein [Nostoc commune]|uniref:hypothetical protein n=1 Tax=Nostoc commune TaxID=1178 RepID=UPI002073BCE9|nr:hypothetical protein [Nostoc commune]